MSKDLFRFRYFQLGETPLGFEGGAEILENKTEFESLISDLSLGKRPNFTLGGIKIEDISANNNLLKLRHDLVKFSSEHSSFFSSIVKKLQHGSSLNGFNNPNDEDFINLVCLGLFGAESSYGNKVFESTERKRLGPLQMIDTFTKDIEEICIDALNCRKRLDSNGSTHSEITETQARNRLKTYTRYYQILTGNENIDLTTCDISIINQLQKLDRSNTKDAATLVSLHFERTIAKSEAIIENEPVKSRFTQNPELRKIFLLIGYKEGLGTAKNFAEFIKKYRKNPNNTIQVLKDLIPFLRKKKFSKTIISRTLNYILHCYTHKEAQLTSNRRVYSVNGRPVDYYTQENMETYKSSYTRLKLNPQFEHPNTLRLNPNSEAEKRYEIKYHFLKSGRKPQVFIELKLQSHDLSSYPITKGKRIIKRKDLTDLNKELAQIINPRKGTNVRAAAALQIKHKSRFKLDEDTILIDIFNLSKAAASQQLKQTFKVLEEFIRASNSLSEAEKSTALRYEPTKYDFRQLTDTSIESKRIEESSAKESIEFPEEVRETENETREQLKQLSEEISERTPKETLQVTEEVQNRNAKISLVLEKLKIQKPNSEQVETILQIAKSVTNSKIVLNGITINLDNIEDYYLAKPAIITENEILLEYEDWGYNTVIHLKKDTNTGIWHRSDKSYNDTGYEKEYISITRENRVIPDFKSTPRPKPVPASSNSSQNLESSTQETIIEKRKLTPIQEIHQNSKIINSSSLKITESMHPILKASSRRKENARISDYLPAYGANAIYVINKKTFQKFTAQILTVNGNGNYKFGERYIQKFTQCMKETLNLQEEQYAIPITYVKIKARPSK